jgi:hypothetical protein
MSQAQGRYVQAAMRDAAVDPVDARGLMPVDDALRVLRDTAVFELGAFEMVRGVAVRSSDRVWAALLSLPSGADFVREAGRLEWRGPPRGMMNVAPVERFGAEILPWLTDHLEADGTIVNIPWCVLPCLFALEDEPRAREILGRIRTVRGADGTYPMERWLGEQSMRPRGPEAADAATILAWLDQMAALDPRVDWGAWPLFAGGPARWEYHAMRLIAVRAATTTAWGIAIEVLRGDVEEEVGADRYLYGDVVRSGLAENRVSVPFFVEGVDEESKLGSWKEADAIGPRGPLRFRRSMVDELDLRPGAYTAVERPASAFVLLIRAYLAAHPDALWPAVSECVAALGLPPDSTVVAVSTAFEHAVPPARPSATVSYQSAARAIVARDPTLFSPGPSNVDWRLHVRPKSRRKGKAARSQG